MIFKLNNNRNKYETINHNYMRSLWALLILMGACSFLAQRIWASIFSSDTMKALLDLPGNEKLPLVVKANEQKPYERLMKLAEDAKKRHGLELAASHQDRPESFLAVGPGQVASLSPEVQLLEDLSMTTGDENEHNHALDYYVNQLIYLLLARRTCAYKLAGLNLRGKLVRHAVCSFVLTWFQFLLPATLIGPQFYLYGYRYLEAWLKYTYNEAFGTSSGTNSIDYELSARIWPTLTQCLYSRFGTHGTEKVTVQCFVPINELCAKLFFIIWWFVVINILIECWQLKKLLIVSSSFEVMKCWFGYGYWRDATREMKQISTFRYRHAKLLRKQASMTTTATASPNDTHQGLGEIDSGTLNSPNLDTRRPLKKAEEAARDKPKSGQETRLANGWWPQLDGVGKPASSGSELSWSKLIDRRDKRKGERDSEGFRERREDLHLYFLMYLLYLRLGSKRKVQLVIKATNTALCYYLDAMESYGQCLARRRDEDEISSYESDQMSDLVDNIA